MNNYGLAYCDNLQDVELPTSLKTIGERAFHECYGFKKVVVPNSVTSIGQFAFAHCSNITSITLPFVGSSRDATGNAALFAYIFDTTTSDHDASPSGTPSIINNGLRGITQINAVTIGADVAVSNDPFIVHDNKDTITDEY